MTYYQINRIFPYTNFIGEKSCTEVKIMAVYVASPHSSRDRTAVS